MNVFKSLFLLLILIGAVNAAEPTVPIQQPPALVNINTADAATLATLTGVGAKKAEDIIKYRQANGGFKTVEEFSKVHGIGPKTFETNRARLTVGDVSTLPKTTPPKPADSKPIENKPVLPSTPSTTNGLTPKM
jgi:competence ComEA-like helix-hairpin-helix protein